MSTPYHDAAASSSSSSQAMNSQQQSQPQFQPGQYAYPLVAGQAPQIQHQSSNAQQALPQSRLTAEQARKDRTLAEFLLMLDDYEPLIPDEVTDYYLHRSGFDCQDVRLKRLLALAAQKFVSDIAADAYQHARIRTNAAGGRTRANQPPGAAAREKARTTLTMEDLSAALAEYGINSRKPEFYM